MAQTSAGILLYRQTPAGPELFLVHPGGPLWAKKDDGAWSIPKGLLEGSEDPLAAARREFAEETGFAVAGPFVELGAFKQPGGKTVVAWAAQGDCDPVRLKSNLFQMEWPPRSGRTAKFPEVARAAWLAPDRARRKILKGQVPIVEALLRTLERGPAEKPKRSGKRGR